MLTEPMLREPFKRLSILPIMIFVDASSLRYASAMRQAQLMGESIVGSDPRVAELYDAVRGRRKPQSPMSRCEAACY